MKDIKKTCLDKWSEGQELDERLSSFNERFEEWIEQIPIENRTTVLTLISNLEYYTHKNVNKWLEALHQQLLIESTVNDDNTIYVFIKSKWGKTNSSNDYWTEYKAINRLNKNICIENIDVLDEDDFKYIENIIYIDDFGGSGKSFLTEIQKYPEKLRGKYVYYITINIMIHAIEKIQEFCKSNDINFFCLSAYTQEKAFCRNLFSDNESAKREYVQLSKKLLIPDNVILGRYKSQSLVAFYNNTPNNTLGLIHEDNDCYKSIFPRRKDKIPKWQIMKKDRKLHNSTNLNNKIEGV